MTWFIVAITPLPISFLMTSTGLTRRRSARSLTEIAGGRTTLRSPFTCGRRTAVARPNWLRAASIARGGRGAAAFRVSLLIFRKFNSSLWLMLSSRASSCAFMTRVSDYDRSVGCRNPALSGYESQRLFCQTMIAGRRSSGLDHCVQSPGGCTDRLSRDGSSEPTRRSEHCGRGKHGHDRNPLEYARIGQVVVEHGA